MRNQSLWVPGGVCLQGRILRKLTDGHHREWSLQLNLTQHLILPRKVGTCTSFSSLRGECQKTFDDKTVTTGITGLWRPSVYSDDVFCFFEDKLCRHGLPILSVEEMFSEVTGTLPRRKLASGSQAFIATLLFDPSTSAFPMLSMDSKSCFVYGLMFERIV